LLQISHETSAVLAETAQCKRRQKGKKKNADDIVPIEQFKPPGFASQFLRVGPRTPAKHGDDAENNSKQVILNNEHGGVFYL
jgi:hypothetical protein